MTSECVETEGGLGPANMATLRWFLRLSGGRIGTSEDAPPLIEQVGALLEGCLARAPRDPAEEERAVALVCLLVEACRWDEPSFAPKTANVLAIERLAGRAIPAARALAHRALGEGRFERPAALEARADLWHLLLEYLAPGPERAALAVAAATTLRRAVAGGLSPFQVGGAVALLGGLVQRGEYPAARVAPLVLAALKAWPGPAPDGDLDEITLGTVLSNFFGPPTAPELPEASWRAAVAVGLELAGEGARCPPRAEAGLNLLYIRGKAERARGEDPLAGPVGAGLRALAVEAEGASPEGRGLAERARRAIELLEGKRFGAGRPRPYFTAAPGAA